MINAMLITDYIMMGISGVLLLISIIVCIATIVNQHKCTEEENNIITSLYDIKYTSAPIEHKIPVNINFRLNDKYCLELFRSLYDSVDKRLYSDLFMQIFSQNDTHTNLINSDISKFIEDNSKNSLNDIIYIYHTKEFTQRAELAIGNKYTLVLRIPLVAGPSANLIEAEFNRIIKNKYKVEGTINIADYTVSDKIIEIPMNIEMEQFGSHVITQGKYQGPAKKQYAYTCFEFKYIINIPSIYNDHIDLTADIDIVL